MHNKQNQKIQKKKMYLDLVAWYSEEEEEGSIQQYSEEKEENKV